MTASTGRVLLLPVSDPFAGPLKVVNADGTETLVTSLKHAAELFGEHTMMFGVAQRVFPNEHLHEYPQPTAEQKAADRRAATYYSLLRAFITLGECLSLVEAHAVALFEADGSGAFTLSEWRDVARGSLAVLYERTPELLPIGPDVHANCGDDR